MRDSCSVAQEPVRTCHGQPPAVGCMLLSADKVFPYKVVHMLEGGMLEYIPLDVLTNNACCLAMQEHVPSKQSLVVNRGKLKMHGATFNTKEAKLSFEEWLCTTDNLVDAMHKHLCAGDDPYPKEEIAGEITDSFAAHFHHLKNLLNAQLQFNAILDYDHHLHALFLHKSHSFWMDVWHSDIFQECLADVHTAKVQALDKGLADLTSFLAKGAGNPSKQ